MRGFAPTLSLETRRGIAAGAIALCAMLPGPARDAHAAVAPPADSLTVVLDEIDRTSTPWTARVRLIRYLTIGTQGDLGAYGALAFRPPNGLAFTGVDSAVVAYPGTQVRWPGLPVMLPSVPAATAFEAHPDRPAGGVWYGLLGAEPVSTTFPGEPVDLCVFVRVIPGASDAAIGAALGASWFGSAAGNGGGGLIGNVAFEPVARQWRGVSTGGGSGLPSTYEP